MFLKKTTLLQYNNATQCPQYLSSTSVTSALHSILGKIVQGTKYLYRNSLIICFVESQTWYYNSRIVLFFPFHFYFHYVFPCKNIVNEILWMVVGDNE